MSNNITAELAQKLRSEGKLESYPIAGTYWFKFNTLKAPFDNVKVRKAFSYAINRQELITHILQGNQKPATGPLPISMALHQVPYFADGNRIRARELLTEAFQEKNWTKATFPKIVLNYAPSERSTKIVQYIQQQWREALGVEVELQSVENHLYRRKTREGNFQVGTGEWIADFNDPLAFLEIFKDLKDEATGNGMNDTNWHNATYSALLELSLTVKDPVRRKQMLEEAEGILVDEMPIVPLFHYAFDFVKKPTVHDVLLSPLGIADFKSAHLSYPKE